MVALEAALTAGVSATVGRNLALPELVPADGLVILRDGEPGEPEVTLSPLTYHYDHAIEVEVFATDPDRDGKFDAIRREIGAVLADDRTLGDRCDWIEGSAPTTEEVAFAGAPTDKVGLITITATYSTPDPLV